MITELLYSHVLNMERDSLHTNSFRRIHLSVFRRSLIENGFAALKVSGAFEKQAPGIICGSEIICGAVVPGT